MKILIPSKDRACQLHLLLESLQVNWPNLSLGDIIVLYATSNVAYDATYIKLKDRFPQVVFVKEKIDCEYDKYGFYAHVVNELKKNEYIGFMVDDGVFYRPLSINTDLIETYLNNAEILCTSLRLGKNTKVQNYLTGEEQLDICEYGMTDMGFESDISWNQFFKYRWPNFPAHSNNGYMFSWDCTFWRSEDLKHYLEDKYFDGPRGMEAILSDPRGIRKTYSVDKPYFVIPERSHYVVNSVNAVQKDPVPCGKFFNFSSSVLNDRYIDGEIIDLQDFMRHCQDIESCHIEIPLSFKKYEK